MIGQNEDELDNWFNLTAEELNLIELEEKKLQAEQDNYSSFNYSKEQQQQSRQRDVLPTPVPSNQGSLQQSLTSLPLPPPPPTPDTLAALSRISSENNALRKQLEDMKRELSIKTGEIAIVRANLVKSNESSARTSLEWSHKLSQAVSEKDYFKNLLNAEREKKETENIFAEHDNNMLANATTKKPTEQLPEKRSAAQSILPRKRQQISFTTTAFDSALNFERFAHTVHETILMSDAPHSHFITLLDSCCKDLDVFSSQLFAILEQHIMLPSAVATLSQLLAYLCLYFPYRSINLPSNISDIIGLLLSHPKSIAPNSWMPAFILLTSNIKPSQVKYIIPILENSKLIKYIETELLVKLLGNVCCLEYDIEPCFKFLSSSYATTNESLISSSSLLQNECSASIYKSLVKELIENKPCRKLILLLFAAIAVVHTSIAAFVFTEELILQLIIEVDDKDIAEIFERLLVYLLDDIRAIKLNASTLLALGAKFSNPIFLKPLQYP